METQSSRGVLLSVIGTLTMVLVTVGLATAAEPVTPKSPQIAANTAVVHQLDR